MNDESQKLSRLQAELNHLKSDFLGRVNQLENKIELLQHSHSRPSVDSMKPPESKAAVLGSDAAVIENKLSPENRYLEKTARTAELSSGKVAESSEEAPQKSLAVSHATHHSSAGTPSNAQSNLNVDSPAKPGGTSQSQLARAPQKPSYVTVFIQWLFTLVMEQLKLRVLVEQGGDYFKEQQQQGKLPVLLLTASGIVILVIALGYLGQYTFNQFSPPLKVGLGYLISLIVLALGTWLRLKTNTAINFVTSLCGLALLIAYLSSYFLGPYFQLASPVVTLLIFAAITGLGYLVAYRLDARILATISLLGGIGLPWLSGTPASLTVTYTAYLFLLNLATLRIGLVLKIPALTYLTVSLTPVILQYQLFSESAKSVYFLVLIHGFFLLYARVIWGHANQKLSAKLLSLFVANLMFYVAAVWQWYEILGIALSPVPFALTAFVFVIAAGVALKIKHRFLYLLTVLHAGVLIALAVISWLGLDGAGVVWSVEALLLLYLGLKFDERLVRNEAYLLFGVSLILNLMAVIPWLVGVNLLLWNIEAGYFASVGIAAQLFLILSKFIPVTLSRFERQVFSIFKEVVSIWIMGAILLVTFVVLTDWTLVSAAIPVFILLHRHIRHNLPVTLAASAISFILLFLEIPLTIHEVGSRHFSDLTWPGRVAAILCFTYLLLVPKFYLRNLPKGKLADLMLALQTLFWLALPLIYLKSAFRHFPEWFALILWTSVGISFVIYHRLKQSRYGIELLVLTITTCLFALYSAGAALVSGQSNSGIWAIVFGLLFFAWLVRYNQSYCLKRVKQLPRLPMVQALAEVGYYFVPIGIAALVYGTFNQYWLALAMLAISAVGAILFWPRMGALRHRPLKHLLIQFLGLWLLSVIASVSVAASQSSVGLILVSISIVAAIGYLLHGPVYYRRLLNGHSTTRDMSFTFFQTLLVLAYWSALESMGSGFGFMMSGALVLHAVALLFVARKSVFKIFDRIGLSLFVLSMLKIFLYDMKDFSMMNKIVGFSVIGIFLLVAAFQFQRSKPNESSVRSK